MTDPKDLAEARKWCEKARKLVGDRKGKSTEIKAARAQVLAAHG